VGDWRPDLVLPRSDRAVAIQLIVVVALFLTCLWLAPPITGCGG